MNTNDFETSVVTWIEKVEALITLEYRSAIEKGLGCPKLSVMNGRKNIRIVKTWGASRSAFCFIQKETGNVLKPAGWKGPAKGVRGNINTEHLGVGAYGANYNYR